jgi:hypothetical protein
MSVKPLQGETSFYKRINVQDELILKLGLLGVSGVGGDTKGTITIKGSS